MTVSTTSSTQSFAGGQASLEFSFRALTDYPEYIKVKAVLISSGAETALTYITDYTVSLNSDGIGGTVTVSPTYSTLYTYTVYRETANVQESDYEDYNQQPSDTFEEDLDRRTLVDQEKDEEITRCLKAGVGATGFDGVLPTLVASRYLKINADKTGIELASEITTTTTGYSGSIQAGADADKPASPTTNDLYFATDIQTSYVCFSSGTWSTSRIIILPTNSTLLIKNSAGTSIGDMDEDGNLRIAGNITTQHSF